MQLTFEQYKKKVIGCFIGKAVGGTLGAPVEGKRQINNFTYYNPVPTEMLPNDDLDLQVVWLEAIRENGLPVSRKYLAEAWDRHVDYHFDEYGMAMRNIKGKLMPPLSGYYNNRFNAGMGAAIRAELWASLAPGNPALATALAREDACVDHYEDGVDGTAFVAALESAAFVESDTEKLIAIGLEHIPTNSKMANAVRDTLAWYKENDDMFVVREKILEKYGTCKWEKGIVNWSDVVINVAFTVLAWLCCKGDFSDGICRATNLGYDTDCTAGIVGSILAIIDPDCVEERWLKPIGTDIVLSANIVGMHNRNTIESFCADINDLCLDIQEYYGTGMFAGEKSSRPVEHWTEKYENIVLAKDYNVREALVCTEPISVKLAYPEGVAIIPGVATEFSAELVNTAAAALDGAVTLAVPDGWSVSPEKFDFKAQSGESTEIKFSITAPDVTEIPYLNILRFTFDFGGVKNHAEAGIQLATPWLLKEVDELPEEITPDMFEGASINYAASFIQNIEAGKKYIAAVDFKLWHFQDCHSLFAAQGAPLKLYIDGVKILEHEGEFYTPSPHRFECSAAHTLRGGWHKAVIAVDNSRCNSDELFFGIGNMGGRYWHYQLEWRIPKF